MEKKILSLQLLFKSMLEYDILEVIFLTVCIKESPNFKKTCRSVSLFPISFLPIFSKILEWFISNSLFNYFKQNKAFTECQSGFLPGDSIALNNCCQLHIESI